MPRVALLLWLLSPTYSLHVTTLTPPRRHGAVRMASITLTSGGSASLSNAHRLSLSSVPRRACCDGSSAKCTELETLFFDRPCTSAVDLEWQELDQEVRMRALQSRLRSEACGAQAACEEETELAVERPLQSSTARAATSTAENPAPAPYDLLLWETP